MSCKTKYCCPNALLIILGLIAGIPNAMAWCAGYVQYVRQMIPFTFAFSVIIFIITAVLRVIYYNQERTATDNCCCLNPVIFSLNKYSPLVLIASAIFIIFSTTMMATYLPFIGRAILAFIGSISFWTMLFGFIAMIFCASYSRR